MPTNFFRVEFLPHPNQNYHKSEKYISISPKEKSRAFSLYARHRFQYDLWQLFCLPHFIVFSASI